MKLLYFTTKQSKTMSTKQCQKIIIKYSNIIKLFQRVPKRPFINKKLKKKCIKSKK